VSIACLGLGMVGSINEAEDNPVHSGMYIILNILINRIYISAAALAFFVGYLIYMGIICSRLWPISKRGLGITTKSIYFKFIMTIVCAIALSFFLYFSILIFAL
jgi:hypothetical protein